MLAAKLARTGVLLVCIFASCIATATTVSVIVTPVGIVIATDSGRVARSGDNRPTGRSTTSKFVAVQGRFVVASVGTSDITAADGTVPYRFQEWMKHINRGISSTTSIDELAETIQRESAKAFDGFDSVIRGGFIKPRKAIDNCQTFIQYIVAGYGDQVAKIYTIAFYIDWDQKKLIGPRINLLPTKNGSNYLFYSFGITEALDDLEVPESYAYKTVASRCPAFKVLMGAHDISLADSIGISKAMVRVEEEIDPREVFGPVAAVTILPNGTVSDPETESRKTPPKTKAGSY